MAIALALGRLGLIALLLWLAWVIATRLITRGAEVSEEQPQRGKAARSSASEPKWQLQVLSVGRTDRLVAGELLPVTGTLFLEDRPNARSTRTIIASLVNTPGWSCAAQNWYWKTWIAPMAPM